ncbi:A24 family peptidase [Heliorestis convoluta]|uniref:Preplin type IV A24A peptidase family protein n=1 Tax=Heliorestis convoluta TaxID=356322 RepID=A0A5Q2N3V4_9FIRM|nr:prepilin peptidase [Heliorestis convoluta]QGG48573.1 Preplin type IV A24A peptidase family protein [Heliorestis convoluta]
MLHTIISIFLSIFILIVCYTDIRYKKIYNWTTLSFFISAMALHGWFGSFHGIFDALLGAFLGLGLLILPFVWGWVGGGDVKFLATSGAFVGTSIVMHGTLYGLILFGLVALIVLALQGKLKYVFRNIGFALLYRNFSTISPTGSLPLGVFLGIGILLRWYCSLFLPG